MSQTPSEQYRAYNVWDAPTRWFHWINALAVLGLISVGVMLLNDDALGLSVGGKVQLKQIHVALGYVMALNLIWRFVWAFLGNRYARWRAMLPYGPGYWGALRSYATAFLSGEPQQYLGHNPAARIAIVLILLLLLLQTATGLILAGTDLFWPPFGGWFAGWVAATWLRFGVSFAAGFGYDGSGCIQGNARLPVPHCDDPLVCVLCACGRHLDPSRCGDRDRDTRGRKYYVGDVHWPQDSQPATAGL